MSYGIPNPTTPKWIEIRDSMSPFIVDALQMKLPARTALVQADRKRREVKQLSEPTALSANGREMAVVFSVLCPSGKVIPVVGGGPAGWPRSLPVSKTEASW